MNELFYEWLESCPTRWVRLDTQTAESSYVFYNEEDNEEDEDEFEIDSRGMGI